jgi:hypothetical protein
MKLLSVQWTRLSQFIIYYFQSARLILQNNKHRVEICTRICAFKNKNILLCNNEVCVCVYVRACRGRRRKSPVSKVINIYLKIQVKFHRGLNNIWVYRIDWEKQNIRFSKSRSSIFNLWFTFLSLILVIADSNFGYQFSAPSPFFLQFVQEIWNTLKNRRQ